MENNWGLTPKNLNTHENWKKVGVENGTPPFGGEFGLLALGAPKIKEHRTWTLRPCLFL
jgi:hypothetical protein